MKTLRFITLLTMVSVALLSLSCSQQVTRGVAYEKLYNEKPVSVLIMPPINNTTNVEAKELLYTAISTPLIEAGYYVFSPHLSLELLKAESAYDAELFLDNSLAPFAKVFGADIVVFSQIDSWKKVGFGIETDLHYVVRSAQTNETLFDHSCKLYLDLSSHSSGGGALGALVNLAASTINTATTDHIEAARLCNTIIFSDFPRGKYSPYYLLDQDEPANTQFMPTGDK